LFIVAAGAFLRKQAMENMREDRRATVNIFFDRTGE